MRKMGKHYRESLKGRHIGRTNTAGGRTIARGGKRRKGGRY